MRARAVLPVALIVAALLSIPAQSAAADDGTSLDLAAVNGRTVEFTMSFDAAPGITSDSPATGTITIDGTELPASTSLTVEAAPPKAAILVLDSSGSMAGSRLASAKKAARAFVDRLPSDVQVGVVSFNDAITTLASPTRDRQAVTSAIDAITAEGDTALYDAVAEGVDLAPAGARTRLVVLTDGQDTTSALALKDVTDAARRGGVAVDVVAMRPTTKELESLRQISGRTGGSLLAAKTSEDLVGAFATASQSFNATADLVAEVPAGIDASGKEASATLTVDGVEYGASTELPVLTSLQAAQTPAPSATPSASPAPSVSASAVVVVPPSPSPQVTATAKEILRWVPVALAALIALIVAIVFVLVRKSREHSRTARRLEQVLSYRTGAEHTSQSLTRDLAARRTWLGSIDASMARFGSYRKTQAALAAGAVALTPAGWLLVRLGLILVLAAVFAFLLGSLPWGLACGFVFGYLVSALWLHSRSGGRRKAFADELPDFLMLLASGLRAGLSFTHSLESAASEGQGEVGLQMRRALAEVRVGADLDVALMEVADRMDNEDLRWTVMALSIQREVGGNLSTILDSAAQTIKARYELRREVRTLSAEGRLSAYILVAMPLGVFAFLAIFRREYISLLWTRPAGLVMLGILLVLMVFGWIWMRAVTRIKV